MAWVVFFVIMWIIVALALYTWYRAVKVEKAIRQFEKG